MEILRIKASEAGVHMPHVASILGQENIVAFSVVLSGGYEDDVHNSDEFIYTGPEAGTCLATNIAMLSNSTRHSLVLTRPLHSTAMLC